MTAPSGAVTFYHTSSGEPFLAAFPLFLNHIANRWPILLDVQHRIAMVSRIDRDVID
jgi:hypothetical protein